MNGMSRKSKNHSENLNKSKIQIQNPKLISKLLKLFSSKLKFDIIFRNT